MSRPLPEELLERAREVARDIDFNAIDVSANLLYDEASAIIARFALAERERQKERDSEIAAKKTNGPMYDGDQMWRDGYETCARDIAEAIRNQ